jgi:hypothetical protein
MTSATHATPPTAPTTSTERPIGRLHAWLTVQTVVVMLVSLNRLGSWTLGYVHPNAFLRWVDFNNMLPLPLASVISFYMVKHWLERSDPADGGRKRMLLNLAFITGLYLLGAGYGDHEVTNYLHGRFCTPDPGSDLCRILIFNDDEFSHWVFFAGFVLMNAALMLLQVVFPYAGVLTRRDKWLLALNALFIGAGIFANLAFEVIELDLYVVALLAALSLVLLWRRGRQPLLLYYGVAYNFGLVATAVYKLLH